MTSPSALLAPHSLVSFLYHPPSAISPLHPPKTVLLPYVLLSGLLYQHYSLLLDNLLPHPTSSDFLPLNFCPLLLLGHHPPSLHTLESPLPLINLLFAFISPLHSYLVSCCIPLPLSSSFSMPFILLRSLLSSIYILSTPLLPPSLLFLPPSASFPVYSTVLSLLIPAS